MLKFRRLLKRQDMSARIFRAASRIARSAGADPARRHYVDATLIAAPPLIKSHDGQCDAGMHQTKKDNQCFGMKAHTPMRTAANESDVSRAHKPLHGDEKHVHGDAGYQGANKREAPKECSAEFVMTRRRSTYKKFDSRRQLIKKAEHAKAGIRAKVECVFHAVKHLFDRCRCYYKRLAKNIIQLQVVRDDDRGPSQRILCAPYRAEAP